MRNRHRASLLVTPILITACGGGGVNSLPPLGAFFLTAPSTVLPGASATASVPAEAGMTYVWSISGGTITSAGGASGVNDGTTNRIVFTVGTPGTISLTCTGLSQDGRTRSAASAIILVASG